MVQRSFIFLVCTLLISTCSRLFSSAKDTMKYGDLFSDDGTNTTTFLVSAEGKFELGFFSPDSKNKYIGIWYHNLTRTSSTSTTFNVWVANRDDPIRNSSGVFGFADDGNLKLMDKYDRNRTAYWSTNLENTSPRASNWAVQLLDSGNLVVTESENKEVLWQSFENPTDTFLPGMRISETIKLISWRDRGDPTTGRFMFEQDLAREGQFKIMNESVTYWISWDNDILFSWSDIMPTQLVTFLSGGQKNGSSDTERFVMEPSGTAVFQKWDPEKAAWSTLWREPKDRCSVYKACGNFGSCDKDAGNRLACNCLPGFKPRFQEKWDSEDYSGGCKREKELCDGGEVEKETFLRLRTVKVWKVPESSVPVANESDCLKACKESCICQAYSFQTVRKRQRDPDPPVPMPSCWIWNTDHLFVVDDHQDSGDTFFVRVSLSDLKPTPRTCDPCGTYTIPYPLSTRQDCGDPLYSNLRCENSTGKVSFEVSGEEYQVTSINPSRNTFVIQVHDADNCGVRGSRSKTLLLKFNELFNNVTKLTTWCDNKDLPQNSTELEIAWDPPHEPACTSEESCKGWPHSSCKDKGSNKSCLCNDNFVWDGHNLTCRAGDFGKSAGNQLRGEVPIYLIIVPTVLVSLLLMAFAVFCYIWRRKMAQRDERKKLPNRRSRELLSIETEKRIKSLMDSDVFKEDDNGLEVLHFDLESILGATEDFSEENKIGQGGYGPVYKGKFPGGQEIAIKRLSNVSGQGLQEFKNEVILIARLQHRNLVKLLGYCTERDEKILIYEYMPNKSLDFFVFDDTKSVLLDWKIRFEIILGIARGMLYLHQDSRLRIIHRDLKTSNILLDKEMNPKIADFGLAKIVGGKETEANTNRVVGTYGYMSPEYALEGIFSFKSDVYSFGVVLLEIVSGKRNTKFVMPDELLTLLGYAWRLWTENKVLELMCQSLRESCKEEQFIKCVNVALLCVQEDPNDRPNMSNIITMLDSETATLPSPKQPAFTVRRGGLSTEASSSTKQETYSEITFTVEDTR